MNAEIATESSTRSVLSISATAEEAAKVRAAVVKEYAAQAAIPGFRKGKAPAHLVEKQFADRIAADAAERIVRESFEKAADGQATKIIVPSEIQSLAGLAASFKGLLEDEKK